MRTPTTKLLSICASLLICSQAHAQPIGEELFLLPAYDTAIFLQFGKAQAVSDEYLAVSAGVSYLEEEPQNASVYVYGRATGGFLYKLTSDSNWPVDFSRFGNELTIHEDKLLVSSFNPPGPGQGDTAGTVYLYDLPTGKLLQTLIPENDLDFRRFGVKTALSKDYAAISARDGNVYVFDVDTGTELLHISLPNDLGLAADESSIGDVALWEDTVLVGIPLLESAAGIPGAVYQFDIMTEATVKIIRPHPLRRPYGFGVSMDVEDDRVLVGATRSGTIFDTGSAFVHDIPTGRLLWTFASSSRGRFGTSVAVSGNTAAIGEPEYRTTGGIKAGRVHVFNFESGQQLGWFTSGDPTTDQQFGKILDITGDLVYVGLPNDDIENLIWAGTVRVHTRLGDPCYGDCNDSGEVDFTDLLAILFLFDQPHGEGCTVPSTMCDVDGDGADFNDLVTALFFFGPCD